jgi:hypothetical protein
LRGGDVPQKRVLAKRKGRRPYCDGESQQNEKKKSVYVALLLYDTDVVAPDHGFDLYLVFPQ